MNIRNSLQLTVAIASLLVASLAQAQTTLSSCPAGTTDPLQVFVGTWTFNSAGFSPSPASFVSAGSFVATSGTDRAGNPKGLLAISQTSSLGGQIVVQEADAGSFQVFPDCSGGTLTFSLSSHPLAFDFWFVNGGNEIYFVSTTPGTALRGTAAGTTVLAVSAYKKCIQAAKQSFASCTNGPGTVCTVNFISDSLDCSLSRLGLK